MSDWMYEDTKRKLTHALGVLMSEISEYNYCSSWLSGLEDELPPLLRRVVAGQDVKWGGAGIRDDAAKAACALADLLGHWANREYDSEGKQYVPYFPENDKPTGGPVKKGAYIVSDSSPVTFIPNGGRIIPNSVLDNLYLGDEEDSDGDGNDE